MTKVRVTTAKGTYWVEEDEVDTIDDDSAADDEVPSGDEQDVEAHDADHEGGLFAWLGDKFQVTPHMAEWLVGLLVAFVAVAVTAYMARDMWFTSDEWEYLANRTAFDLGDLTRPVGGHWTTWSVLLLRGLYTGFGVDFWPWFYIPRLIGHTVLVTFIWRVMRRRGTDPLVGIFAYAVLLVLGASGYQRALQVGNWAVYAALIICALVINRRPAKPTTRDQVIVAGALMVAVFGNGYAVAVIGGIIVTLLLARRLVAWIPSLIPAVLAYGIWYLNYRNDIKPKPELKLSKVLDIPSGAFRVVRTAMEAATGFPTWLAAVAVLGLLAWIVLLAVRRKFDLFDAIILSTLAIGLCLLVVQRISIDDEAATRLRYGYSVSILLAVALVPHIRLSKTLLVRAPVRPGRLRLDRGQPPPDEGGHQRAGGGGPGGPGAVRGRRRDDPGRRARRGRALDHRPRPRDQRAGPPGRRRLRPRAAARGPDRPGPDRGRCPRARCA